MESDEKGEERDRLDHLIPVVYEELRGLAGLLLSDQAAIQPTSLVHEVYLRLLDQRRMDWQDRLHFLRVAARVMRRVLVDQCRARAAKKRGGLQVVLELEEALAVAAPEEADILTIDRLWDELQARDPQQAATNNLGWLARRQGDFATAEARFQESLGLSRAVLGEDHPETVRVRSNLAPCCSREATWSARKASTVRSWPPAACWDRTIPTSPAP